MEEPLQKLNGIKTHNPCQGCLATRWLRHSNPQSTTRHLKSRPATPPPPPGRPNPLTHRFSALRTLSPPRSCRTYVPAPVSVCQPMRRNPYCLTASRVLECSSSGCRLFGSSLFLCFQHTRSWRTQTNKKAGQNERQRARHQGERKKTQHEKGTKNTKGKVRGGTTETKRTRESNKETEKEKDRASKE